MLRKALPNFRRREVEDVELSKPKAGRSTSYDSGLTSCERNRCPNRLPL
jgi:hypothetical protein